jgi:hypothetical protein
MRSHRGARGAVLLALTLVLPALAGCSHGSKSPDPGTLAVTSAQAQHLLDVRAAAIRHDDLAEFLGTLDRSDRALVARQRRYFANMEELPLESLHYKVLKSDWPGELRAATWGSDVSLPQVQVGIQLTGFDAEPVRRITGFAFGRPDGVPVIVSELTGAGKQFPGSDPAPWDLVRVHVRTAGRTLQLYDDDTWKHADELSSVLLRGIADVRSGLPFAWSGRVVMYVFSRKAVLDSYQGVPGGNINHLGAMTFPMYAVLGQPTIAGVRFTLLPSSVAAGQPFLDRITRHELTHVAVGYRDDGDPTWFAEGLAEYMGARSLTRSKRRIATVAVGRARQGVDAMPASATFNGPDQAWNYALSWMACDYIAATQGPAKLWELMSALHDDGRGTTDDDQDTVLERVLGIDSEQLAGFAAQRILRIYG